MTVGSDPVEDTAAGGDEPLSRQWRTQDIRSLRDIDVEIFETDGGFSFLLRDGVGDDRQQRGEHKTAAS